MRYDVRMRIASLALTTLAFVACAGLKSAETGPPGPGSGDDAGDAPPAPPPPAGDDGGATNGGIDADVPTFASYDEAQAALEKKRFPGPTTAQGSTGYCAPSTFVWRDGDGSLHSWSGATQQKIDYTFKAARAMAGVSDVFLPVDITPSYQNIAVYRTDAASTQADTIPYAFNFVGSSDGVIRLDQKINNVSLNGTKVRKYVVATQQTTDVSQVLSTVQPPSSWAHDKVVIPADVTAPYPIYVVDVTAQTTAQVTFDGGSLRLTHPATYGLLVSYARTGPTSALRLYKGDQDVAGSRVEIGDEVKNLAGLFPDSPAAEHDFLVRVAQYKNTVIYDSAFGIFAFDVVTGKLYPIQLGAQKKAFLVDTLCVLEAQGLLVYRNLPDSVGQIWVVPLAGIVP
jgi:hypothetical protein